MSPHTYQVSGQRISEEGTGKFSVQIASVEATDFEDAISRFCKSMERRYREGGLVVSNTEDFLVEVYDPAADASKVYSIELNVQFAVDFEDSDVQADPHDPAEDAPQNEGLPQAVKDALRSA